MYKVCSFFVDICPDAGVLSKVCFLAEIFILINTWGYYQVVMSLLANTFTWKTKTLVITCRFFFYVIGFMCLSSIFSKFLHWYIFFSLSRIIGVISHSPIIKSTGEWVYKEVYIETMIFLWLMITGKYYVV